MDNLAAFCYSSGLKTIKAVFQPKKKIDKILLIPPYFRVRKMYTYKL